MEYYTTAAKIGQKIGVSYRTIENWAAQGYVKRQKGGYCLISAFEHRLNVLEKELGELQNSNGSVTKEDLLKEEIRLKKAMADVKELERDEKKKQLVSAELIKQEYGTFVAKCRAKLLVIPTKMALHLSAITLPEKIEDTLRRALEEALLELGSDGEH